MTTWALVPVKAIGSGKQRLSGVLDEGDRGRLVRAMLADVLAALGKVRGLDGIAILTPEPALAPNGTRRIEDPGGDVNAAVAHAATLLRRDGITTLLVLAADVPLATPGEIEAALAAGRTAAVVIVPDRAGRGTNALVLSPPDRIASSFGENSRAVHAASARRRGIEPAIADLPGLAFDVDEPADLERLRARASARPAYAFLRPLAVAAP